MAGVELRHFRYFVAVAEQGGISTAAERLYVSQPAVSKTIRQLENELGTTLLRRCAGGVELTADGERFLADARVTLQLVARIEEPRTPAPPAVRAELRVAMLPLVAPVAHTILKPFLDARPGVALQLQQVDFNTQLEPLRRGEVDVEVLTFHPPPEHAITVVEVLSSPAVVGMSERHRLASRERVRFADIADETWPGRDPSTPLEWADAYWLTERRGRRPRVTAETPHTPDEVWSLIVSGKAIVTVPRYAMDALLGRDVDQGLGVVARPLEDVDPFVVTLARRSDDERPLVRELFEAVARS